MLVLSRKASQSVIIGDNITVVVLAVNGGRVKLGFSAPGSVLIHREEVWRRDEAVSVPSEFRSIERKGASDVDKTTDGPGNVGAA